MFCYVANKNVYDIEKVDICDFSNAIEITRYILYTKMF